MRREDYLWKLERALYGLRKAPKYFAAFVHQVLGKLGWRTSQADPQLWINDQFDGAMVSFHVDDLLLTASSEFLPKLKQQVEQVHGKWL